METDKDPLEGCSFEAQYEIKVKMEVGDDADEIKDIEDEGFNAMALLELATCVQTEQEPIEFNSTDVMVNAKTGLMVCLHCLIEIESNLLTDHMINAHSYRKVLFKCRLCDTKFPERKLLMAHKINCQPQPKKSKKKSFIQVMKEFEESKMYGDPKEFNPVSCPICILELPSSLLREHLNNEHKDPELELICGMCKRKFKTKLTLREHVKLVHNAKENSAECELCGQKFSSRKYLTNHKRNVHPKGNKIHQCEICDKIFKSRLCLHQHIKHVHPPESASVECPYCPNKIFKAKMNLQQHLRVSHGERRKKDSIE